MPSYRISRTSRRVLVAAAIAWFAMLVGVTLVDPIHSAPFGVAFGAFGVLFVWASLRPSVVTTPSTIVIRNSVRTITVHALEIERFEIGPPEWSPFQTTIVVVTNQGRRVPCMVFIDQPWLFGRRRRAWLEAAVAELESWRSTAVSWRPE